MVQVAYPLEFPLEEIQQCIRIVTSKVILQEKELFAAAAWNVQGFGQKMLVGPPDRLPQSDVPAPPTGISSAGRADLRRLHSALGTVDRAGDAPQSLPLWLEMLVKILMQAITDLIGE